MASAEISSTTRDPSVSARIPLAARRWLPIGISAILGILLLMAFVDGPVAAFAAGLPAAFKAAVAVAAAPLKGTYLLFLSLFVAASAFTAARISPRPLPRLRRLALDAGFVFAATALALACATLLKVLIGRARPELLPLVGPHAFAPFSTAREWTSFPSGETSMITAFFSSCALLAWKRGRESIAGWLLLPAVLIAASRPIVGAHHPSDVLGAILLSAAIVLCLYRAVGRLLPSPDAGKGTTLIKSLAVNDDGDVNFR